MFSFLLFYCWYLFLSLCCCRCFQHIQDYAKVIIYKYLFFFLVECPQYKNLTDADRKYGPDTTGTPKCDDTLNGWYRFHGDAGRKMMTTCPSINKCGGRFSAWLQLNGDHPTVAQGSVLKTVCIRKRFEPGNCCEDPFKIHVKNCGSYFIYKLVETDCYTRYCGTD